MARFLTDSTLSMSKAISYSFPVCLRFLPGGSISCDRSPLFGTLGVGHIIRVPSSLKSLHSCKKYNTFYPWEIEIWQEWFTLFGVSIPPMFIFFQTYRHIWTIAPLFVIHHWFLNDIKMCSFNCYFSATTVERFQWTDATDDWVWLEIERFCELAPGLEIKLHRYSFCRNFSLYPVRFADKNFISWFLPAIQKNTYQNFSSMSIKCQYFIYSLNLKCTYLLTLHGYSPFGPSQTSIFAPVFNLVPLIEMSVPPAIGPIVGYILSIIGS